MKKIEMKTKMQVVAALREASKKFRQYDQECKEHERLGLSMDRFFPVLQRQEVVGRMLALKFVLGKEVV